ncbi:hypothetical protein [Tychonema sp. LEGE 07203]|uniref:hypothetical protein n=1 Tax=Tychonema sp. LEGE 07203 TaxID=1828671 RepID=UPI001D14B65F|nr:hypothetical protein [Tychonema sp. LEGE 07203]
MNDILSLFDRLLQRSFRFLAHRWPKFYPLKMDASPQFNSWRKKNFRSNFKIPDSAGEQISNLQCPNLKSTDIVSGCKRSNKIESTLNSQLSTLNSQQSSVNSQQLTHIHSKGTLDHER